MQANLQFQAVSSTIAFVVFALAAYILVCTRVPRPTATNTDVVSGRVANVVDGGVEDVTITLADDDRIYYINRGLERGVNLNRFAQRLEGKQVELRVIRRMWSPLDPSNRLAPVGRVTLGEEILIHGFLKGVFAKPVAQQHSGADGTESSRFVSVLPPLTLAVSPVGYLLGQCFKASCETLVQVRVSC